jgi:hypothetical protein
MAVASDTSEVRAFEAALMASCSAARASAAATQAPAMEVATSSYAKTNNSQDMLVVFVLNIGDSAMHLHGAIPTAQEEDLVVDTDMVDGLGLTLLLPICHHV